jgi:hypothetical protein
MRRNGYIWRVADHFIRLSYARGGKVISDRLASRPQGTEEWDASEVSHTHDPPFPIRLLAREIQRDREHVNIGERTCQSATPIFEVGPIYIRRGGQRQESAKHTP